MRSNVKRLVLLQLVGIVGVAVGCDGAPGDAGEEASWSALLADGDVASVAPGARMPAPPPSSSPRFCPSGDCAGEPLAFWTFDDCNTENAELGDSAFSSPITHPAFRAVSVACVAGASGQGVKLAGRDDIVYAPDQPDFTFDQGLTIAAFIKPDRVTETQSIVRKRLDGSSSFTLALDNRKLTFAVRLTSGRLAGVSAPVQAGRFTHVAATYDGQQLILYVDGVVAARARAAGTIARGAGPIFVGNDADGRQLKGIVDQVWLNTLAAPAGTIAGLTCIRQAPVASLSPGQTPPEVAGTTVPFDLSVTNPSSPSCPVDSFQLFPSLSPPLVGDAFFAELSVAPGQTGHATVNVRSSKAATVGSFPFQVFVANEAAFSLQTAASATYVVGTGPISCDGFAPLTPQIIGSPASPAGGPFTFAAPGLTAPVATPVLAADGTTQALQVEVNPGAATDPANAFLGFGVGFGNPPCLDASAFTGIKFTVTGDLGTCALSAGVITSEDNSVAFGPVGVCTASACIPPSSAPLVTGANVVRFADMSNGSPMPTVDPSALNGVQWTLTVPTDGVTAPCTARFTISDVSFIND